MKQIITLLIVSLTTTFLFSQNGKAQLQKAYQSYDEAVPQEKLYLHTDRSLYKPGETIWFKAYLTDAKHLPSETSPIVYAQLLSPKGSVVQEIRLIRKNGIIHGEFPLGANIAGGLYKIRAHTNWMKNQGERFFFEKEITVQGVVLPRLLMKLDFEKDAYGPNDEVTAELDVRSLDDLPLARKSFNATVDLDGSRFKSIEGLTDKEGKAKITFQLPKTLKTNDALLNIRFFHDGQQESISRSVPIVLNDIDIQFFAEGGDVILGMENKIAFKALNEFGMAADIAGELINDKGTVLTSFESFHKGMGAFTFTPEKGQDYRLRITRPAGIEDTYALPKILDHAFGLRVLNQDEEKLYLNVYSPEQQSAYITGFIAGQLQQVFPITLEAGNNKINIPTSSMPVGILQLTLFDNQLMNHAERLVFVNKHRKISVDIKTDKDKYLPRESVSLSVSVKDEDGKGIPGDFSLAVIDDQIHTFADDKQDNILSYLLMSSELKGQVEEPNFYFDPKEEKADDAIELVMMTHGWRRFQWRDILEFNDKKLDQFVVHQPDELVASGRLLVDGAPVSGARVWLQDHSQFSRTDKNGYFSFTNVSLPAQVETRYRGLKANTTIYYYSSSRVKAKPKKNNQIYANGVYKGRLIDETGEPMIGANINIKGTDKGTVSDIDGNYSIEANPGDVLVVNYIGYKPMEFTIENVKNQPIALVEKEEALKMDDFVEEVAEVEVEDEEAILEPAPADEPIFAVADEKEQLAQRMDGKDKKFKAENKRVAEKPAAMVMQADAIALNEVVVAGVASGKANMAANALQGRVAGVQIQSAPNAPGYFFETAPGFNMPNLYFTNVGRTQVQFHNARQFYAPVYNQQQIKATNGTDRRKTLFWVPNVKTDNKGKYECTFSNSDEESTFRIVMEGISDKGQVIRHESTYSTQKAVSMISKMPVAVTHGDTLLVPVAIKNNLESTLAGTFFATNIYGMIPLDHTSNTQVSIPAGETHTEYYKMVVDNRLKGPQTATFTFNSEKGSEFKVFNFTINPKGFPRKAAFSSKELQRTFTFDVNDHLDNTLDGQISFYPNIMEELFSGAESILREPHGCFEQTSSSNYPNIMALQYMQSSGEIDPNKKAQAIGYLKRGYAKLAGYECSRGGFEWWGNDPAHETLTAYGLIQFTDMKKVYKGVDEGMIARTAKWLMDRRDGKGGFEQRGNGLDRFRGSSYTVGNAYICYALSESGFTDIEKEVRVTTEKALSSNDAYLLSLMALSNFNLGNKETALKCLSAVGSTLGFEGDKMQVAETVTRSYGNNRYTEAASLYAQGLMRKDKVDQMLLDKVIMYIAGKRNYGGFGSTQSTVLALKAMVDYANFVGKTDKAGKIQVYCNGEKIYDFQYQKGHRGKLNVDLKKYLQSGENTITVAFDETDEALPYSAQVEWTSLTPASSEDCRVDLITKLASKRVQVGETVRLTATIKNMHNDALPTPIALIGIPAGLSLQPWQLKELKEKKVFDYYEIQGNYLVAYFTSMDNGENKVIHLDLKADIPGSYKAPASTAYLYYDKQDKDWDAGTFVSIIP